MMPVSAHACGMKPARELLLMSKYRSAVNMPRMLGSSPLQRSSQAQCHQLMIGLDLPAGRWMTT
jgi:hypothetical protein